MIAKKLVLSAVLCALCALCRDAYASEARRNYVQAQHEARQHNYDAAFMSFRSVLRDESDLSYRQEALFATGEYYYLRGAFAEARRAFGEFLKHYPSSLNRIFVSAYLLRIAETEGQTGLAARITQHIVTMQQVSLVFRESKEYSYVSGLQRTLKVVYYIDKVEFYADDKLFKSIPY